MSDLFRQANMEGFLAKRLRDHGSKSVEDGVTDAQIRAQRFREIIARAGLAEVVIGRRPGKGPETYREYFQRCYGEAL